MTGRVLLAVPLAGLAAGLLAGADQHFRLTPFVIAAIGCAAISAGISCLASHLLMRVPIVAWPALALTTREGPSAS